MCEVNEEILATPDKKPLKIYLIAGVFVLALSAASLTATVILRLEFWFYIMDCVLAAGAAAVIVRCAYSLYRLPSVLAVYKDGVFNFYPVKNKTVTVEAKSITWVSQLSYTKRTLSVYGKIVIEHKSGEAVLSYVKDAALASLEIKKRCPVYTEQL